MHRLDIDPGGGSLWLESQLRVFLKSERNGRRIRFVDNGDSASKWGFSIKMGVQPQSSGQSHETVNSKNEVLRGSQWAARSDSVRFFLSTIGRVLRFPVSRFCSVRETIVVSSGRFSGLCQRCRLQRPTVNYEKFMCCPHNLPNSLTVLNKELASTTGGFRI